MPAASSHPRPRRLPTVALSLILFLGMAPEAIQADDGEVRLLGVLESYCVGCHGGDQPKAGLDLGAALAAPDGLSADATLLEDILFSVEDRLMPPPNADRQPTDNDRAELVGWIEATLDRLQAAAEGDPGLVVMPRLTRSEYDHVIRDLTGLDLGAGRYLPADGGAGEGFANVGEAQGLTLSQLETYLKASREIVSHLRASPESGLRWHETRQAEVLTPRDRREEIIGQIVLWYGTQEKAQVADLWGALRNRLGMTHGAYLEAAWQYRYRQERGQPDAKLSKIAGGYEIPLSPASLEKWWYLIHADDNPAVFADALQPWHALPGPGEINAAEVRAVCQSIEERFEHLFGRQVRYANWDFAPDFERSFSEGDERKATLRAAEKEGRWPFSIKIGDCESLYLIVTDAGDGNDGDLVTWQGGRFTLADGSTVPWQEDSLSIQAPDVSRLEVPEGATLLEIEARLDPEAGPDGSVQVLILDQPPAAEDRHVYPRRPLLGHPDGQAVESFKEGQAEARSRLLSRNRKGVDQNLFHKTMLNAERNVLKPFDLVDHRYVGGPWPDQEAQEDQPAEPYFRLAEVIAREADPEARAELDRLHRELAQAAQPVVQDLLAFLKEHGVVEPVEGVLPPAEVVSGWEEATQSRYEALRAHLNRHENKLAKTAREQLEGFGRLAWRRPLTDREIEDLETLFQAERGRGVSYDAALKVPLRVVLVSPHFLFRHQRSTDSAEPYPLDDYEIASRLSFFLWASIPDDELLDLAAEGRLRDPNTLQAQARRMLADEKARALATDFAGQWLHFDGFDTFSGPDSERFPEFTDSLRWAMHGESVAFFDDLFRNDRSVLRLIDANDTFVNEELAQLYGIEGVSGDKLRQVELADGRRGGILGMGSVLTQTSTPLRTSPVHRGVWVLEQVLGEKLPTPPADIPPISDDETDEHGLTATEQLAQHRADPNCASCHDRIDPIGLALENFDPIGRWRETDSAGNSVESLAKRADGEIIDGVIGLREYLLIRQDEIVRQFCRKLTGYALGRAVQPGDAALLDRMQAALESNEFQFTAALDELILSRQFLERRDPIDDDAPDSLEGDSR